MKLRDMTRLGRYEARMDKKDLIRFIILEIMLVGMTFFLITLGTKAHTVMENVLSPIYPNGYLFWFEGFSDTETPELESMGFYDLEIGSGSVMLGRTKQLGMIWIHKLKAVLQHKDIFNGELEELCAVLLLLQVVFITLAAVFFACAAAVSSNLCRMTLESRRRYISMLSQLGLAGSEVRGIFMLFFLCLWAVAVTGGIMAGTLLLLGVNRFLTANSLSAVDIRLLDLPLCGIILLVLVMMIGCGREWRRHAE